MLTLPNFDVLKNLCFWQNREKVFNWLNSASRVGGANTLGSGFVQELCARVICRGHANYPEWIVFINRQITNREGYEIGFNLDSLRVKHRCQLVVRQKAIKCYKRLFYYLSFLSFTSDLLFIFVTALFVAILFRLQEVKRPRHSSWYRIVLFICSDPVQAKPVGRAWRSWLSTPWGWCIK